MTPKSLQELLGSLDDVSVINASGTMTHLGASRVPADVADVVHRALPRFVDMHHLQGMAARVIASTTGSDAGCITASAASGIAISIAAAMTGLDVASAQALPRAEAARNGRRIVIQRGHVVDYGAPILQKIGMVGGVAEEVGTVSGVHVEQLDHALAMADTAAGLFVISHHTVQSEQVDLPTFVERCHAHGRIAIVDAASEYDLQTFIDTGADLVIYSGHKFLSGPTSGIVAGTLPAVRAAYMHQVLGIGRAMKVGKESILGALAALLRWRDLDHRGLHDEEQARVERIRGALERHTDLDVEVVADPTGNPISRVRVHYSDRSPHRIAALADGLRDGDPSIWVRDHHVDNGFFDIDPCNMSDDEAETVIEAISRVLPLVADQEASDPTEGGRYGPRRSRYDSEGQPRVDRDRVPFMLSTRKDRNEMFASWPDEVDA